MHNSYNATRVLFNPDIVEVNEFIAKNWYSLCTDMEELISVEMLVNCSNTFIFMCFFTVKRDPDRATTVVTEFSQLMPTQFSQQATATTLMKERRVVVSEIPDQKQVI